MGAQYRGGRNFRPSPSKGSTSLGGATHPVVLADRIELGTYMLAPAIWLVARSRMPEEARWNACHGADAERLDAAGDLGVEDVRSAACKRCAQKRA